jgi:dihydroorotase
MALLLRNAHLVDPAQGLDDVMELLVGDDGRIAAIGAELDAPEGCEVFDCMEKLVMPGFVDAHTHLREPGREDEETVYSGTRAAALGGFTGVCAMPNTEPVADEGSAIRFLVERAATEGAVRVYPIGAITAGQKGEALAEIGDMLAEGAVAFSDDGRGVQSAGMMRLAMDYIKQFGVPLVSHAEDEALAAKGAMNEGYVSTLMGLPGIPAAAEDVMVARDILVCDLTGCRLHVAHLSTAGSIALVREAKERGLPVTCEVTPHHLFLTEDALRSGYDTNLKMNPPLRTEADREALLEGVEDGTVDCIATDHAPHAAHEKQLEFELAPFGTIGLQTALPLVNTHLVAAGRIGWDRVVELMAHGPRRALGLPALHLAAGAVADLTVFDPEARVEVTPEWIASKSRNSAFMGQRLLGKATEVLVGGRFVVRGGRVVV